MTFLKRDTIVMGSLVSVLAVYIQKKNVSNFTEIILADQRKTAMKYHLFLCIITELSDTIFIPDMQFVLLKTHSLQKHLAKEPAMVMHWRK